MCRFTHGFAVISVLLVICPFIVNATEERCKSLDIRNTPESFFGQKGENISRAQLMRCAIMEGDVTISMIYFENGSYNQSQFPVFKNLREITGSVLLFQVQGLTSLGHMFPNLRIIGGHSLIMNYALVIYQNEDLLDLGLNKLTTIRNGGVRITENARLCFIRHINWDDILIGNIRDVLIEQGSKHTAFTQKAVHIPVCKDYTCEAPKGVTCHSHNDYRSCWNATECQRKCKYHRLDDKTIGPGCAENGERCHDTCLGGCMLPNDPSSCHACKHVKLNKTCLHKCPDDYYLLPNDLCITLAECDRKEKQQAVTGITKNNELVWKAFQGRCHYNCPHGFEADKDNEKRCRKCDGYCPKRCHGGVVDSIGEAMKYSECNVIEGHLEIEIQIGSQTTPAEKFTEAFSNIQEITDYLSVRFSPSFISLHMFKKLRVIHGKKVVNEKYALSVLENPNLRQIFGPFEKVKILNGTIIFQNNRMLCYNKIIQFAIDAGVNVTEIPDADVSTFSNGDRAVCEEVSINVTAMSVSQYGFMVNWTKFTPFDMDQRKFLGYQLFYKRVEGPDEGLSIDDDRSACADSWQMLFFKDSTDTSGEFISGLDPYTWYAYYVQTKIIQHPGARTGISKINFVQTHFGSPDPPRINFVEVQGPKTVFIAWDPPIRPNGNVTHYMVTWTVSANSNHADSKSPCDESSMRHSVSLLTAITKTPVDVSPPPMLDTCPIEQGCCKCVDVENKEEEQPKTALIIRDNQPEDTPEKHAQLQSENAKFENAVQNLVFVQQPENKKPKVEEEDPEKPKARESRAIKEPDDDFNQSTRESLKFNNTPIAVNTNSSGKVNVTTRYVLLDSLHHYTEYRIVIFSCQDIHVVDASCTLPTIAAVKTLRTSPLPENDMVDKDSIVVSYDSNDVEDASREATRRISWGVPLSPNGVVRAFKIKVATSDETPIEQCVSYIDGAIEQSVVFTGLSNGKYDVEIRTVSLAGVSNSTILENAFEVNVPLWIPWPWIIGISAFVIFLIVLLSYIGNRQYFQSMVGTKMREYLQQTISANPDYLSTMDVYTPDEWELKREQITIFEEIGRGTFGKVYRGMGNTVLSQSGITFGRCAIKTVADSATQAERIHFLIEASVMKLFNTPFIVRLLGVVSSSQNLLVVMEMMDLGNLRDFLRARRPDAEENVTGAAAPTMIDYFKWALQIADGMTYLETEKFCHRDLAARNCMVTTKETVKIGDFGMARDIYYHEYYKPSGKRLMPVRWMSPEALKDGKFTTKSDIWAYGIVLYEMLTLGVQPYGGLANDGVFNYIGVKREVLPPPQNCPDFWYDLMRTCWKYDPRDRPFFYQIFNYLKDTVETIFARDQRAIGIANAVFNIAHTVNTRHASIDDTAYDFVFKEEVMLLPQNHILEGIENDEQELSSDIVPFEDLQYYKTTFDPDALPKPTEEGGADNGLPHMKILKDLKLPDAKMREALRAEPELVGFRDEDKEDDSKSSKPKSKSARNRKKHNSSNDKSNPLSRERQIAEAAERAMLNVDASTSKTYQPMENVFATDYAEKERKRNHPNAQVLAAMEDVYVHIRPENEKLLGSRYRPPDAACSDIDYENEANQEKRPLNPK